MIPEEPRNSLYQIFVVNKQTGRVILDSKQPALNEAEAILLAKVGSVIDAFGLTRDDVDFYIRSVAVLYEGKTFKAELEQKPLMTAEELDAVLNPRDSLAEIDSFRGRIDDLKARVEAIEAKITSA